ncbi:hypothetical protein FHR99_002724 [Litorivivens lipolytica]|uniref:N-acetyltransferase n=1 Tax=Litorivivens lipolytica TaxID=1524264 RepID=A0A7W4W6X9_9GAMM|nr:GNAT family N-acetyltransferase [Litorivivens lipolytica]MBB3048450.1 hypothetical protein [Litorivivens lipolytica]
MTDFRFVDSIDAVPAAHWDNVLGSDYPFLRHSFLQALEHSGATQRKSGWQPHHLVIEDQGKLIGHLPLYLKYHSYGEYVFDWSWADAWHRNGLDYYPKLLSAIPFTPATGPRLSLTAERDTSALRVEIGRFLCEHTEASASSLHVLFTTPQEDAAWQQAGLAQRIAPQYHWFNRGYESFDDFLATFSSRKRKSLRRERRLVDEAGVSLRRIEGPDITPQLWRHFYHCYQMTYAKRSGHGGYLNQAFFEVIGRAMPDSLLLVLAERDGEPIACALNFKDANTLYGRYWGCVREVEFLHFEACYYQGIEYCIEQGLKRFDPGAQGEHKIQRGFEPIETRSRHWIVDPRFRQAVERFLGDESPAIERYLAEARQLLPFKCTKA